MNETAIKKKSRAIRALLALGLLAVIAVGGFYFGSVSRPPAPTELRVGVLPDQEPAVLRTRFSPLVRYLGRYLDLKTRLIIPESYEDIVRLFRQDEIDLAFFGGLTFVQAQASAEAEPLVMREVDTRFISWFVAKPGQGPMQLSDLRGKKLTFGNRLSTSGHLMPRYFMQLQWDLVPEKFFSEVHYSEAHDQTAYLVRDANYAVGAVNAVVARQMLADGRLGKDELQVLWQTPPYPDYVWAVQPDLDEAVKIKLRDAFLRLDGDNAGDNAILLALGAETFLPAGPGNFETLANIAQELGLIEGTSQ